jgi:hypothetical protein
VKEEDKPHLCETSARLCLSVTQLLTDFASLLSYFSCSCIFSRQKIAPLFN